MNLNKKKKGFTIVELVIVIAVIGILSAILIPTFANLINKANVSADVMTVRNINTQLKIEEATNGAPTTFGQMLGVAGKAGYDIEKLNPTTEGYSIVWDKKQNTLFLYDKNGKLAENQQGEPSGKENLWAMVSTAEEAKASEYNVYLRDENVASIEVANGIEVVGNTNVTFKTDKAGEYTVVLNGGELTVEAPNATVNSFGEKSKVIVNAVDKEHCYNEFGKVLGNIQVTIGKIVMKSNSSAAAVVVMTNEVKVEIDTSANTTVAPGAEGVEMNTVAPTVPAEKKVEEIPSSEFAGGLGTKESPYLVETAEQWYNVIGGATKSTTRYYKQIADIDVSKKVDGTAVWSNDNHKQITYKGKTYNSNQITNYISYDGCGHTLKRSSQTIANFVSGEIKNLTMDLTNVIVEVDNQELECGFGGIFSYANKDMLFENITVTSSYEGLKTNQYGTSVFCMNVNYGTTIFRNCVNYASYEIAPGTAGYAGIFLGNYKYHDNQVIFENCTNYGIVTGKKPSLLIGNPANNPDCLGITVTNCANYGKLIGTVGAEIICSNANSASSDNATSKFNEELMNDDTKLSYIGQLSVVQQLDATLISVENKEVSVDTSSIDNASKILMTTRIGINLKDKEGKSQGSYYAWIDQLVNAGESLKYINAIELKNSTEYEFGDAEKIYDESRGVQARYVLVENGDGFKVIICADEWFSPELVVTGSSTNPLTYIEIQDADGVTIKALTTNAKNLLTK